MIIDARASSAVLICVVVSFGHGNRVVRLARQHGIKGGTVFPGLGTVSDRVLSLLGISDVRKEIVLLGADTETANRVLDVLNKELRFDKRGHGIAFTTTICHVAGTRLLRCDESAGGGEVETVYQIVMVIVDKGKASQVIDAATKAGSRGGTIIHARGSGIHETKRVFSVDIEPEKEIVMILCNREKTGQIVTSIREQLRMDVPGNGIVFTQNVNEAFGLYE